MHKEQKIRILAIPVLAVLITLLFNSFYFLEFGVPVWKVFLSNLIFTTLALELTRWLVLQARKPHHSLASNRKRLLVTTLGLSLEAVLVGVAHVYIEKVILFHDPVPQKLYDYIGAAGNTFFFTVIIASVYEGSYYFRQLLQTAQEKEALEKSRLQAQLDLLKTQVQPHFLFNSLNTLVSLIDEDPKKAKRFVKDLSNVYRYLLRSTETALVSLRDELDFLQSYLSLLKTRFEEGLQIRVDIQEDLLHKCLPVLTLQLLIENAVKHNQLSPQLPLLVLIHTDVEGRLVVRNNLRKKRHSVRAAGVGLANLSSRYRLLNLAQVGIEETEEDFSVTVALTVCREQPAG